MHKHEVKSASDALAYMVDCTLATVCDMASKKKRPVYEYARQIAIAQSGVEWMLRFYAVKNNTRANDVIKAGGSVAKWAEQWESENA